MKGYLILIGANKYAQPGNDLHGCINDLDNVETLAKTLYPKGNWEVYRLADENNTAAATRQLLKDVAAKVTGVDYVWVHNSSHGTTFPIDDIRHHATCPYDFNWTDLSTFMLDRDWVAGLNLFHKDACVVFTSDSCHAAGLTARWRSTTGKTTTRRPKSIQPPVGMFKAVSKGAKVNVLTGNKMDISAGFGCGPDQTSADITDGNGVSYGAYTNALAQVLKVARSTDFKGITKRVNQILKINGETQRTSCLGRECDRVPFDKLR
jgi:hypothetical protein